MIYGRIDWQTGDAFIFISDSVKHLNAAIAMFRFNWSGALDFGSQSVAVCQMGSFWSIEID